MKRRKFAIELNGYNLYGLFLKVVELKNYSRVAEVVGLSSHSIVSDKMKILEKKLGIKLFKTGPCGAKATSDALALYDKVKSALRGIDMAEESIRNFNENSDAIVRIVCITDFAKLCLIKRLPQFILTYPKVRFDIQRVDSRTAEGLLRNSKVDLIVELCTGEVEKLVGQDLYGSCWFESFSPPENATVIKFKSDGIPSITCNLNCVYIKESISKGAAAFVQSLKGVS